MVGLARVGLRTVAHQLTVTMSRSLSSINTLKLSNLSINNNNQTQVDVQVIVTDTLDNDVDKLEYQRPAYVAVGLIMAMTAFSILFPLIVTSRAFGLDEYTAPTKPCLHPCTISLVESIPQNLTYPSGSPTHPSTFDTWRNLIKIATKRIEIASFYWTLRGSDIEHEDPSDWQGQQILKDLLVAGTERKIKIHIAQSEPTDISPDKDTADLAAAGAAIVRSVNFTRLLGAGVLHTKLWIVDRKHIYIGSANMDWRSLTQVKEMGVVVYNCSCLAADMAKIFEVYWYLGLKNNTIPYQWPLKLRTVYNNKRPMQVKFNNTQAFTYISSSPSSFCPSGRTVDLDAILDVIQKANKYVYVAVMDYFPTTLYTNPIKFWPIIDNALRRAAIDRQVEVRLMASWWNNSRPEIVNFLRSLADLNGAHNASVHVRLFHVPACTPAQAAIPYARVNHNKYMVTDTAAYIGTSNWSGDYFLNTGGVGLIVNQTDSPIKKRTVQAQLRDVFLRDWDSPYAMHIDGEPPTCTRKVNKKLRKASANDL